MEYSDAESNNDGEVIDDILGPEDLFNDEADDEAGNYKSDNDEAKEKSESVEDEAKEKVEKKVKTPRVVKNPRVTLNYNTLRDNNGLSALKKLFQNFKFKGNSHEQEDLAKIMSILQQWMCYQLCPSYDFESVIIQLENLGKKKIVQTLMKKYRLGMDDWGENKSDAEDNNIVENVTECNDVPPRDEFDMLLDEEIARTTNEYEISQNEIPPAPYSFSQTIQKEPEILLTPEQLERIARNKKLAEERRLKRMSAQAELMDTTPLVDKTNEQEITLEKINLEEGS